MEQHRKTIILVGEGLRRTAEAVRSARGVRFLADREGLFPLFSEGGVVPDECALFLHFGKGDDPGPFFRRAERELPRLLLFAPLVACFDGAVPSELERFFPRFDCVLPISPEPGQLEGVVDYAALKKRESFERDKRLTMEEAMVRSLSEGLGEGGRAAAGGGPGLYYGIDDEGFVRCVSDEVLRILGFSREEIIGHHFTELVSKEELEHARIAFTEKRTGERRSKRIPVRLRRHDGGFEEFVVDALGVHIPSVATHPNKDPNRLYIGTVGLPRKRGSDELAIDIFERSLKPILIHSPTEGKLLANRGFELFSGYSQGELYGKSPEFVERPDRSLYAKFSGGLGSGGRCVYSTVLSTKSGEERYCEVSLDFVEYDGKPYVIAIYNDVTGLMQLLEEAEALIRLSWYIGNVDSVEHLVETAAAKIASVLGVPFYSIGLFEERGRQIERFYVRSGKTCGWRPRAGAAFFGRVDPLVREALSEVKTVYRPSREVFEPSDTAGFADSGGGGHVVVAPLVVNNRPIGCTVVIHEDENSFTLRGVRLLEIATNVVASGVYKLQLERELRKNIENLETRVKERTKEFEDFVYTVSHDLKSPLHAARGFSDMVQSQFGPLVKNEEDEYILRRINENIVEAITMINDLLKLSRIGTQELKFEEVDLGEIVRDYADQFRAFRRKDIALDLVVEKELPHVHADRGRVVQLLVNLFDNSVKYRRGNAARVEVGGESRFGRLHVSVKDDGIGMKEEELPHIFKIFYRIKSAGCASHAEGTGLGLPIVKKIVEQHGGTVEVRSRLGEGTTVTFDLPLFGV